MKVKGLCMIYDSKYGRFGKWLESKCSGKDCDYCSNRPKRHPYFCKCKKRK
jgi:hypothetical protein